MVLSGFIKKARVMNALPEAVEINRPNKPVCS